MLGNARECILGFLSPGDLSLTSVVYTELMLFSDPYGGIWFLRLWCRQSLAHKYMHFKNELKEFKRLWLWSTMRERITIYTYRERVREVVCVHWIPNAIRRVDASWFISKQHIHSHTQHTQWLTFANYLSVKTEKHLLFRAIFISRGVEQVSH